MSSDIFIDIVIAVIIVVDVVAYMLMRAYAKDNKIEDDADGEELT